ncbi:diguanylate cyclase [Bosea sp. BK604]|uniref:diguanylate cyclase n=1 Tax=Bosea sp. BK604 TaxID=2512180 RepID=UPI0010ED88F1|nr:diguanylate cyclase [Bosea sp. BK604]TCR61132.1 diguanylate cyclase (GGDEF)-like protein [Bosea sp. BK604]
MMSGTSGRSPIPVRPRHLNLSHRFWAAVAIVMACSLALGLSLIDRHYRDLEANRASLSKLMAFRQVMNAANQISAERGPTNAVLGQEPSSDSPSRRRLRDFRANTDAALERVAASPTLQPRAEQLRRTLARARQQVDGLTAVPFSARSNTEITSAIETMFGVYDATQPLIEAAMSNLLADEPDLVGRALVMRMLGELREYAGRLGSHLVIPIAHGEPMSFARRAAFEQTRGRVLTLWDLARQRIGANPDPAVAAAHEAAVTRFFGEGMALVEQTLAASTTGEFGMTPAQFTDRIVPSFAPLEQLRDAFVTATVADLRARGAAAQNALLAVTAATALALVAELSLLIASQKLLFRPLLKARGRIVALANGEVEEPIASGSMQGEMRSLFEALEALRQRLIERNALDRERAMLTDQLKRQAENDGLTGVLNRGALERLAAGLTETGAGPKRLGLILLDIDHFKAINDGHGHAAGDEVLKETARRLCAALRQDDVIARFGGEEFAILLLDHDSEAPSDIAERLRSALHYPLFRLESGAGIEVTASFGTALRDNRSGAWPELIAAADLALYRAKAEGRNRVVADALT